MRIFSSSYRGTYKGKWYIFIYSISNINKKVIESIGYLFWIFEIPAIY